jgi:nucleoside-diphosphate kinase
LLVKPDAVKKHTGSIIQHLSVMLPELHIIGMKMQVMDIPTAKEFYIEHEAKTFYLEVVNFMASGPHVGLVVFGFDAVKDVRGLSGHRDPNQALPGTFRRMFGSRENAMANATHSSDSVESAKREIALLFEDHEIWLP